MSSKALFVTARTRVCRMTEAYLDLLVDLDSDPEVMRYINGGTPTSRERLVEKLGEWTSKYDKARPAGFWAVHLRDTDEFIGWVHLKPDWGEPEFEELGYRLKRAVWGHGLATEVAAAMLEQARRWDRSTVVARTLLANRASQRVMEKCGMTREFEFVYPRAVLPDWTEKRRRAVRYRIETL